MAVILQKLPGYQGDDFVMTCLEKGGSGRQFYRIRFQCGLSVILVQYTQERIENEHYVEISRFLTETGVRVPRIHFHEPELGLIFMQDLGEEDLWSYRNSSWEARRLLYQSALSQAFLMHNKPIKNVQNLKMELEFNEQLYILEQRYFFENCVEGVWGMKTRTLRETPALSKMAALLAGLPRMLVHRDFHSQNIIICSRQAWLIDFQGMRPGLGLYDVASLLYDPYVQLPERERQELLAFYRGLWMEAGVEVGDAFGVTFLMCAAQRLMQALGAYGFLGLKRRRKHFLQYIPVARRLLHEVASNLSGFDPLVETLDQVVR